MRALVVVNPRSRRGARLGATVRRELTALGVDCAPPGSREPVDAVVVAGGDGTFTRAIPLALARGVPMGLIPLGTFNELARTLEIPLDVAQACALIVRGATRAIDVARVNGVYYVNEASIGISSRITRLQRAADKRRWGWLAILWSVVRGLRYARPFRVEIEGNGRRERLSAIQVTVANSHRFGGLITVEDAAIDDGQLDCYALEGRGLFPVLALALAALRHRAGGVPELHTYRAPAIEIRTRRRHRIVADGEPAGRTPARFEVCPGALKIFSGTA